MVHFKFLIPPKWETKYFLSVLSDKIIISWAKAQY